MSEPIRVKLATEKWPIERVHPYENNAKIHTQEQIEAIAKSLRRFGWDQPIVVDGAGVIIKGHGRLAAAKYLNMETVDVVVRTDLTANEANASRLADNRVAEGGVDTDKLQAEIVALSKESEIDLGDMGFSEKELAFLTEDIGKIDESAIVLDGDEQNAAQITRTAEDLKALSIERIPLQKIFGVREVSGEDAAVLTRMMNVAESRTGKIGMSALIVWAMKELDRASAA